MKDNKLVDFIAAILTGGGLYWLNHYLFQTPALVTPPTIADVLQNIFLKTVGYVFVALTLFLWKHKLRAQLGWIVIAILGLTVTAGINELVLRNNNPEPDFLAEFPSVPLEIFLFIIPALLFMGIAHYIGLLIMFLTRKYYLSETLRSK